MAIVIAALALGGAALAIGFVLGPGAPPPLPNPAPTCPAELLLPQVRPVVEAALGPLLKCQRLPGRKNIEPGTPSASAFRVFARDATSTLNILTQEGGYEDAQPRDGRPGRRVSEYSLRAGRKLIKFTVADDALLGPVTQEAAPPGDDEPDAGP